MSCCLHKKYDVKNHIHILGYGGKRLGGETTRGQNGLGRNDPDSWCMA